MLDKGGIIFQGMSSFSWGKARAIFFTRMVGPKQDDSADVMNHTLHYDIFRLFINNHTKKLLSVIFKHNNTSSHMV